MNKLIIYNGSTDIPPACKTYSYSLGLGKVLGTIFLNNTSKLNELALNLRDEYSNFIYDLNTLFIKNNLTFEKLSLYFISDISNKRTEFFDTYISICHIIILKEEIEKKAIKEIELVGCSKEFEKSFLSVFSFLKISKKKTIIENRFKYNFLRQVKFYTKFLFNLIYFKLNFANKTYHSVKKLFLTGYPKNFYKDFVEKKYGNLVREDDVYLVSILSDGLHQGYSFRKNNNSLKELKFYQKNHNILLIDNEINFYDLIKNFIYSIYLPYSFKNIKNQKLVFKGIDISDFLNEEIKLSVLRIPRLILYRNALKKIFEINKVENFYYYLHEFCYGRFFSYILNQYSKNTKKIGFQSGPTSMRKMLFSLSINEVNYSSSNHYKFLPMPDDVLSEDEQSKKVYEAAHYKNIKIMNEIPRLEYLKYIKRNKIEKNSVLVACGLHDGELIFEYLKDEIKKNTNKKYYFKLHPRAYNHKIIDLINESKINNIKLSEDHISKYLSFVEEVIYTYSSVGVEAYKLGLNVRNIALSNKINESPLLDYEGLVK